jgi:hypothetical protein
MMLRNANTVPTGLEFVFLCKSVPSASLEVVSLSGLGGNVRHRVVRLEPTACGDNANDQQHFVLSEC